MERRTVLILMVLVAVPPLLIYMLSSASITENSISIFSSQKNARINISFMPLNPRVAEPMIIELKVTNGNKPSNMTLETLVLHEGSVERYRTDSLGMKSGESRKITIDYVPVKPGKYDIAASLYNSNGTMLIDSSVAGFRAKNDIGPFDLQIILPTNFVSPGGKIPVTVKMNNFGLKGTDVKLILTITCFKNPDIEQSVFIYLKEGDAVDKSFIMPTCDQVGQHRIKATLMLYDTEYVSVASQYFEKDNITHMEISAPELLVMNEDDYQEVAVKYTNKNPASVNGIEPIVFGIPSSWFTVTPLYADEVKSGEFFVSIVKISLPSGSKGVYPIIIGVSSQNLFSEKLAELRVEQGTTTFATVPEKPSSNTGYIIILSAVLIAFLAFFIIRNRRPSFSHKLSKIKYHING